jgi:hypothetical protein
MTGARDPAGVTVTPSHEGFTEVIKELDLPPQIVVSTLRGESRNTAAAMLTALSALMRDRANYLAAEGLHGWVGEPTVVLIVPSHDVFRHDASVVQAELLARMGRTTGIHLRLVDAIPPMELGSRPLWALQSFGGSRMLRDFAGDDSLSHVTYEYVTVAELTALAEGDTEPAGSAYGELAAIRSKILQYVKMYPGGTAEAITREIEGSANQIQGMLGCLINEGILVIGTDHLLYDVADAIATGKVRRG